MPAGVMEAHLVVVQHGTHPTEESSPYPASPSLPLKVGVIQGFIGGHRLQELGQLHHPGELVHVDEGVGRGNGSVVLNAGTHHNRHNPLAKGVGEELFCDVVFAVGVLEGKVEPVIPPHHLGTFCITARTLEAATATVDVHLHLFPQRPGVLQPIVPSVAIRHKPGHHLGLVGCMVLSLFLSLHCISTMFPLEEDGMVWVTLAYGATMVESLL